MPYKWHLRALAKEKKTKSKIGEKSKIRVTDLRKKIRKPRSQNH